MTSFSFIKAFPNETVSARPGKHVSSKTSLYTHCDERDTVSKQKKTDSFPQYFLPQKTPDFNSAVPALFYDLSHTTCDAVQILWHSIERHADSCAYVAEQ